MKVPTKNNPVEKYLWELAARSEHLYVRRADLGLMTTPLRIKDRVLRHHVIQAILRGTTSREIFTNQGSRQLASRPGSVFFLAPGMRHSFEYPAGTKVYTIWFDSVRPTSSQTPGDLGEGFLQIEQGAALIPHFPLLVSESIRPDKDPHRRLRLRSFLTLILTGMCRENAEKSSASKTLDDALIGRFSEHISRRLSEPVTAADLADLARLSPEYFTKVFTRSFGLSPRTYILREKMNRAASALLETGDSVEAVARRVGYESLFSFSRLFKKTFGMSPAHFRKKS